MNVKTLIVCLAASSCAAPVQAPATQASAPAVQASAAPKLVTIAVLGTADLHGRMAQLPIIASAVNAVRAKMPTVLLDGGDAMQGTLESDMEEGTTVIDAYGMLGYTAMAIGNHEFDYGPEGKDGTKRYGKPGDPRGALKARVKQAKFPVLAANLLEDGQPLKWDNVSKSVMVKVAGIDVGIIGITTEATLKTTLAANLTGVSMANTTDVVTQEAASLRARGASIVLVAAHAGGQCENLHDHDKLDSCDADAELFDLARALPKGAVDGMVGGHTHQGVAQFVAGIPIIESFSWGKMLGRFDLDYDTEQKKVVAARIHDPVSMKEGTTYEGVTLAPDAAVAALVKPALEAATAKRNEKLGPVLQGVLKRSYDEESPLGNFITTEMLSLQPKADFAVQNGGGLRADFPDGPLTYGAVYQTLPFDNRLADVHLTGAAARKMFEYNLQSKAGILSIAGGRVEAVCKDGKLKVELFLDKKYKGKKPVKDDDQLWLVTNDFVATGGDGVLAEAKIDNLEEAQNLREAVVEYLKAHPDVFTNKVWLDPKALRIRAPSKRPVHCK